MKKFCQKCGKKLYHSKNKKRTVKYCIICSDIVAKEQKRTRNKNRIRNKEQEAKYNREVRYPRALKKAQEHGYDNTFEYFYARKAWADTIKERDGICLECGSEYELEAHHIIPVSVDPSKTFDLLNGETLCVYCHRININSKHSSK